MAEVDLCANFGRPAFKFNLPLSYVCERAQTFSIPDRQGHIQKSRSSDNQHSDCQMTHRFLFAGAILKQTITAGRPIHMTPPYHYLLRSHFVYIQCVSPE